MLYFHLRSAAAILLVVVWAATVSAQQTGGGTATGQTGGTTTGTGTGTGTGSGIGTGTGTGIGGTDTVNTTLDAETAFSNVERGDTIGATGTTGESFSLGGSTQAGGRGAGGIGGLGGLGGGLGALGNLFGGFNQGTTQSTKPAIRTRLRSAISVPPTSPAFVQQVATQRFRSLAGKPQLRGINITMQGRTAVISGVVASERDRRMSELLMRLEPGVSSVDNQIVVTPEVPSPSDIGR